ncbi:hypothetical protein GCM10027050_08520 [Psychrosphaera aestuarii]
MKALREVLSLILREYINSKPTVAAIDILINKDKVGAMDSLLQTIPNGVVDQTKTTTKNAIETGIVYPTKK